MDSLSTKEKLIAVGKKEFLQHGFKDASLRSIGKKAGFTLGAFYGYYPSKEALFNDIVGNAAEELYGSFDIAQNAFTQLSEDEQVKQMETFSGEGMKAMLDIIYRDADVYKILFFCAAGTGYENFLQRFVDMEIESTKDFIEILRKKGHDLDIDNDLIHILASAMLSGMMEVLAHDMNKDKATKYIQQMREFYSAGWRHLLSL